VNLQIDQIKVDDRCRKDLGDINAMAKSLNEYGMLHPVVVLQSGEGFFQLIAGERRLTGAKRAGWDEVPVTIFKDRNELQVRSMELEENIKRKNLTIAEQARGVKELEETKQAIFGKPRVGVRADSQEGVTGFGRKDTAKLLGKSVGAVTQDIQIAEALEFFPDLEVHKNKHQILKEYKRRKESMVLSVLAQMDAEDRGITELDQEFLNVDCLEWMAKQKDKCVDLIIADPPWGIDLGKSYRSHAGGRIGKEYEDDVDSAFMLMKAMVPELFRILRDDRHMYFFFGIQFYKGIRTLLRNAGFIVDDVPLIWNKTHFTGPPTGNRWPCQYETIFFCRKGDRKLDVKSGGNVLSYPIVLPSERVHPSQKPADLYLPMIESSSEPNELVYDPTAGSGSVHMAASRAGRRCISNEKDKDTYLKSKDNLKEVLAKPILPNLMGNELPPPTKGKQFCQICGKPGPGLIGSDGMSFHDGDCYNTYRDLKAIKEASI